MYKYYSKNSQKVGLLKVIIQSCLIVPTILIASIGLAAPVIKEKLLSQSNTNPRTSSPLLNPSPSIFNEPPYNRSGRTLLSPVNPAPTTQPGEPGSTLQPPLPETQQTPSAIAQPVDGKINIKLINTTNAVITYQVIGDTEPRSLTGKSEIILQNLQTPITLTFGREDKGLIKVNPQATSAGILEVMLDETTSLDEDTQTMIVQQSGNVLLN